MKFLMAFIMTTAFSASAFGACTPSTAKECSKAECSALSKEGGVQFSYDDNRAQKCMTVVPESTTNCLQTNNSGISKTGESSSGTSASGSSSAAQK